MKRKIKGEEKIKDINNIQRLLAFALGFFIVMGVFAYLLLKKDDSQFDNLSIEDKYCKDKEHLNITDIKFHLFEDTQVKCDCKYIYNNKCEMECVYYNKWKECIKYEVRCTLE